jgi:hypothetical protein
MKSPSKYQPIRSLLERLETLLFDLDQELFSLELAEQRESKKPVKEETLRFTVKAVSQESYKTPPKTRSAQLKRGQSVFDRAASKTLV